MSPFAPGTLGAIEGVALFLATSYLAKNLFGLTHSQLVILLVALNVVVFWIGVWASGCACKLTGLKDPQKVIVDEISGQLIALIPVVISPSAAGVIIAFALFRSFDIFKPYPIRKLETLPGGFGVMADDALAGVFAGGLVWVAILFHLI